MSETLWAVIIGGAIAVIGSAATQLLLFWLNNRKEKQERRLRAIEQLAVVNYQATHVDDSGDVMHAVDETIAEVDSLSDEELSGLVPIAKLFTRERSS